MSSLSIFKTLPLLLFALPIAVLSAPYPVPTSAVVPNQFMISFAQLQRNGIDPPKSQYNYILVFKVSGVRATDQPIECSIRWNPNDYPKSVSVKCTDPAMTAVLEERITEPTTIILDYP